MSFTTRCPACGTMFKVVPDQLKISDGWVRCGHCSDVFDAMLNLQGDAPAPAAGDFPPSPSVSDSDQMGGSRVVIRRVPVAAAQDPSPAPAPAPADPASKRLEAVGPSSAKPLVSASTMAPATDPGWDFASAFEEPEDAANDLELEAELDDAWDGDWLLSPQSMSEHRDAVTKELEGQALAAASPAGGGFGRPVTEAFERELGLFAAMGSAKEAAIIRDPGTQARVKPAPLPAEDSGLGMEGHEPGFVLQGRREAFWRRPAVRAGLWGLVVALSGALALQWAVHERDQLAARHPFMVPWLQAYCDLAACDLAAPQRINAVAIDSSTLVRKLGQLYSFDLVVKNSDAMPVAMPALELSLTDGRDKEIARRVFLPHEMPGTPKVVPAHGSLSVSMRLSLSESDLVGMAGYRALVFYP